MCSDAGVPGHPGECWSCGQLLPSRACFAQAGRTAAPEGESLPVSSVPEAEELKMNSTYTTSTFSIIAECASGC